jgi:hypothetical protein
LTYTSPSNSTLRCTHSMRRGRLSGNTRAWCDKWHCLRLEVVGSWAFFFHKCRRRYGFCMTETLFQLSKHISVCMTSTTICFAHYREPVTGMLFDAVSVESIWQHSSCLCIIRSFDHSWALFCTVCLEHT